MNASSASVSGSSLGNGRNGRNRVRVCDALKLAVHEISADERCSRETLSVIGGVLQPADMQDRRLPRTCAAAGPATGALVRVAGPGGPGALSTDPGPAGLDAARAGAAGPDSAAAVPVLPQAHGAGRAVGPTAAHFPMNASIPGSRRARRLHSRRGGARTRVACGPGKGRFAFTEAPAPARHGGTTSGDAAAHQAPPLPWSPAGVVNDRSGAAAARKQKTRGKSGPVRGSFNHS
jgi:hypothetical protein